MAGAPGRNDNAKGHGLYSARPQRHVQIQVTVGLPELATYAVELGAAALWVAETLADAPAARNDIQVAKLVGLYASVAQELYQVTAELEGKTGIKPASLGELSDERYEALMGKQARALELILNQCISAWKHIEATEEYRQMALVREPDSVSHAGLFIDYGEGLEPNRALNYLAAHMRAAKRIMREMAANQVWKERGVDREDDLMLRLLKVIEEKQGEN